MISFIVIIMAYYVDDDMSSGTTMVTRATVLGIPSLTDLMDVETVSWSGFAYNGSNGQRPFR